MTERKCEWLESEEFHKLVQTLHGSTVDSLKFFIRAMWEYEKSQAKELSQAREQIADYRARLFKAVLDAERAEQQLAECKKDVERYRWLHNGDVDGLIIMRGHVEDTEDIALLVDGDELDEIVDHAIAASPKVTP